MTRFSSVDELVDLVNASDYGLSLGILAKDAFRAYELADRLPSGILHINDQTVDDESQAPFGGHEANIEAFTETQGVTMQADVATYPF